MQRTCLWNFEGKVEELSEKLKVFKGPVKFKGPVFASTFSGNKRAWIPCLCRYYHLPPLFNSGPHIRDSSISSRKKNTRARTSGLNMYIYSKKFVDFCCGEMVRLTSFQFLSYHATKILKKNCICMLFWPNMLRICAVQTKSCENKLLK